MTGLFIYNEPCDEIEVPLDCVEDVPQNRRLDAMVAKHVFGCDVEWVNDRPYCNCESKRHAFISGLLAPYSSEWNYAEDVIYEMEMSGYWLELRSPFEEFGKWWAGFTQHGASGWNGNPDYKASGSSGTGAICRAALLWALYALKQDSKPQHNCFMGDAEILAMRDAVKSGIKSQELGK